MKDLINDLRDDMLEATDLYDKEGVQITRFAMGKGKGTGIQINFSKP